MQIFPGESNFRSKISSGMDEITVKSEMFRMRNERDEFIKQSKELQTKVGLLENIQSQLVSRCQELEREKISLNARLKQNYKGKLFIILISELEPTTVDKKQPPKGEVLKTETETKKSKKSKKKKNKNKNKDKDKELRLDEIKLEEKTEIDEEVHQRKNTDTSDRSFSENVNEEITVEAKSQAEVKQINIVLKWNEGKQDFIVSSL